MINSKQKLFTSFQKAGIVMALNRPNIFVLDLLGHGLSPEHGAMLMALYSRRPDSLLNHLASVKEKGPEAFMKQFFVQYGHDSIGDCGSLYGALEYVSLLALKALQEHPLFNGQETSTRYTDMSNASFVDPLGTESSRKIQEDWMKFYSDNLEPLKLHLKKLYPFGNQVSRRTYETAIKARAFDILGAFIPAGLKSYGGWHMTIRQAYSHFSLCSKHPVQEVRDVATTMLEKLSEKYPSSFERKLYPETEAYQQESASVLSYSNIKTSNWTEGAQCELLFSTIANLGPDLKKILVARPAKNSIPYKLAHEAMFEIKYKLCWRSWRDAQRHRTLPIIPPLLTTDNGFEGWYLEQLPHDMKARAEALIGKQTLALSELDCSEEDLQYYIPMGYRVAVSGKVDLRSLTYFLELRSGKLVHQTLRKVVLELGDKFTDHNLPVNLHLDTAPVDGFYLERGAQDIIAL